MGQIVIWFIFPTGKRNLPFPFEPLLFVSLWIFMRTIEPVAITGICLKS